MSLKIERKAQVEPQVVYHRDFRPGNIYKDIEGGELVLAMWPFDVDETDSSEIIVGVSLSHNTLVWKNDELRYVEVQGVRIKHIDFLDYLESISLDF